MTDSKQNETKQNKNLKLKFIPFILIDALKFVLINRRKKVCVTMISAQECIERRDHNQIFSFLVFGTKFILITSLENFVSSNAFWRFDHESW